MMPPTPEAPSKPSLHAPALLLTTALLIAFLAITAAYARWGMTLVKPTFRESQLGIVEGRDGWRAIVIYEDTLRVLPEENSIRDRLAAELRRMGATERAQEVEAAKTSDSRPESPPE